MPPRGRRTSLEETRYFLELARKGDAGAWRGLHERSGHALLVFIHERLPRNLLRHLDAEDVAQDVFQTAMENLGSFHCEGKGSFTRWLRRIAANAIASRVGQKDAQRRSASMVGSLRAASRERDDPAEIAGRTEFITKVARALQELPVEDQFALHLRLDEEWAWNEIAKALGLSVRTAQRRHAASIQTLRHVLRRISRDACPP